MIGKLWKFTLFFLLCLVVALFLNWPIQQVLAYLSLPPTVRVAGVDGTIVQGMAREIRVGQFPLRDVEYRFRPSCLALLRICYRIDYRQGRVQVAHSLVGGGTVVSSARVEYPVNELARYVPNLPVNPIGRLELRVDDLAIDAGRPSAVAGKLVWRELGIDNNGKPLNLGDYELDFTGGPQGYRFKLKDIAGSLDIDGEGEVGADGQYRMDIRIVAGDSLDPQVRSALGTLTRTVSQNHYRVDQRGQLPAQLRNRIFR